MLLSSGSRIGALVLFGTYVNAVLGWIAVLEEPDRQQSYRIFGIEHTVGSYHKRRRERPARVYLKRPGTDEEFVLSVAAQMRGKERQGGLTFLTPAGRGRDGRTSSPKITQINLAEILNTIWRDFKGSRSGMDWFQAISIEHKEFVQVVDSMRTTVDEHAPLILLYKGDTKEKEKAAWELFMNSVWGEAFAAVAARQNKWIRTLEIKLPKRDTRPSLKAILWPKDTESMGPAWIRSNKLVIDRESEMWKDEVRLEQEKQGRESDPEPSRNPPDA